MYDEYKKDFPGIKEIPVKKASELLKKGNVVFVDVRKQKEMNISMIKNAISKKYFLENISVFKDKTIIAYCTIGARRGKFVKEMSEQGIVIFNLPGSILAWVLEGKKVYDTKGESIIVHVYGNKWNFLPSGYQAVVFNFFIDFDKNK